MKMSEIFFSTEELPNQLKDDEFYELILQVKNGSREARNIIAEHNIRLVLREVNHKFVNYYRYKQDFVSLGFIALLKAIDTYDLSAGYKFSSYAIKCIDNEIMMFIRKLKKEFKVLGIDNTISFDDENNTFNLDRFLKCDDNFVNELEQKEFNKIIREIVEKLPEKDKKIIELSFGFNGKIYTQEEISKMLNLSQASVSRTRNSIIEQISEAMRVTFADLDEIKNLTYNGTSNRCPKKIKTLYEVLSDYSHEEVDKAINMLTDEEKELIKIRYGENLNVAIISRLTSDQSRKIYSSLIPRLKRMLKNFQNEKLKDENNDNQKKKMLKR